MPDMQGVACDPAKRRTHRNSILRELREMQEVAYSLCRDSDAKPSDVAQLMRAYVACDQQRNVLRMRPAPKPIDVSDRQAKRRSRSQAVPLDGQDPPK